MPSVVERDGTGRAEGRVVELRVVEVRGVLENYIHDPTTDSWASLIVWPNPEVAV